LPSYFSPFVARSNWLNSGEGGQSKGITALSGMSPYPRNIKMFGCSPRPC
jgi:hypothetical protein